MGKLETMMAGVRQYLVDMLERELAVGGIDYFQLINMLQPFWRMP